MYKEDLVLNNIPDLLYHKTNQPSNQPAPKFYENSAVEQFTEYSQDFIRNVVGFDMSN